MLRTKTVFPACLVVASLVLAWGAVDISLLDDDWGHLLLSAKGISFIWSSGWEGLVREGGYYRPAVVTSFYLDYLVGGFAPAMYHLTNVVIHGLCSYLVFLLGRRLQVADHVAWGSAFLFFVLPIHADSIFWIVGRTDSLCALFYLGALNLFLKYLYGRDFCSLMGFAVCSALALLSKEMALSLPLAIAGLIVYNQAWKTVEARRGLWALGIVVITYFVVRWFVLGSILGGTPRVSVWDWGVDGLKAVAKMGMTDLKWFGIFLFIATVSLFAFEQGRGIFKIHKKDEVTFCRPFALLLVFLMGISLAPALGHLHNWYLYLPSAFFCMGISVVWLDRRRKFLSCLFGVLVLYYAVVLGRESLFWQDASDMSEGVITDLMPFAQKTSGRLVVFNVPAAWTPEGSFSGKPLFAYALKNALVMRSDKPVDAEIIMGNHVWLTDVLDCHIVRTRDGIDLSIEKGGVFSFHGNASGQVPPFELVRSWGTVTAHSYKSMSVLFDTKPEDCVVVYTQGALQEVLP